MQLSNDQSALSVSKGDEQAVLPPQPVPPALPKVEDPEARQSRKLALMAALSDGLPTLPAYVFELNSLLAAAPVNLKRVGKLFGPTPA